MKTINLIRQSAAALLIAAIALAGCRDDDPGKKSPYTVAFDSAGGSDVASQTVEDGGTAVRPDDPVRAGYAFDNWYLGNASAAYSFGTPVTADITLTAGWIEEGGGGTGDGTEASPFRVATEADLRRVGTDEGGWTLKAHYLQTADITLTEDWTPIGVFPRSFNGVYNGGGKTISGLKINALEKDYQGLFESTTPEGIVKNVGLIDVNINGSTYVGGIAGSNSGTIQGCFVSGHVASHADILYSDVGGIAGSNLGTIENCYVSCNVVGKGDHCGGIAGDYDNFNTDDEGNSIRYCYAAGSVTGEDFVGGIAGSTSGLKHSETVLQNCVALNSYITETRVLNYSTSISIGRIYGGYHNPDVYSDNYSSNFPVQYDMNAEKVKGYNGVTITEAEYYSAAWWSGTAGFPAGAWIFEDGKLPVLRAFAAGTQDPPPPEDGEASFNTAGCEYWGDLYGSGTANFILTLYHSSEPDYGVRLDCYSALPDAGFAGFAPATGTYTVTDTEDAGTAYPGYVDQENYINGCYLFDDRVSIYTALITGGALTIARSGGVYTITADMTGEDADTGEKANDIRLTFTGPITFTDRSESSTDAKSVKRLRAGRTAGSPIRGRLRKAEVR